MEEIQDARIDGSNIPRSMVAKDVIDVVQDVLAIPPPYAVGRIQSLPGVRVVQGKRFYGGGEAIDGAEHGNGG